MDNQNDLQSLSVKLYHYLCDVVVGSEKVVKYRRYFYKCFDDYLNHAKSRVISSGSKAEGLDLPGSDLDLMQPSYEYIVDEDLGNTKGKHLVLDTYNALPGFALIKVSVESDFKDDSDLTLDGCFLKHDIFKKLYQFSIESQVSLMNEIPNRDMQMGIQTTQGPAISILHEALMGIDFVRCFPCRKWPSAAYRWLNRNRCCKWPSSDLMTEAMHEGVLLVPVGSKSPTSEGNPSEWRFSFSLTEKLLVHSFNHSQLLCYALLKIFLKEVIDKINIFNKLLCSYYMKTVLFWVLEEVDHTYWVPENLLRCFSLCLQRLHYFIFCNYIPNYFIPEHNMMDGRFSEKVGKQLEIFIEKLLIGNIWEVFLSVDLLSDLLRTNCYISKPLHIISEFDKTLMQLNIPDYAQFTSDISFSRSLSFFVYRIRNENCPTFFKNIYAIALLDWCKRKATSYKMRAANSQYSSNKQFYSQYKQCLFHLLLYLNSDAVSGWLLLAAFFYSCQEYHKMNAILQLSDEILSNDLYTLSFFADASAKEQITFKKMPVLSRQYLKRLRHSLIRHFLVVRDVHNEDSYIYDEDLSIDEMYFAYGTPKVFRHYLTFLYFHKQNNTEERKRALVLLQEAVEKSPQLDAALTVKTFSFLLHAQLIMYGYGIESIETIRRLFSAYKPYDYTGMVSGIQADFEKECELYFNE